MTAWEMPDFGAARAVKRGEGVVPAEYAHFAADLEREFGVPPLFVSTEALPSPHGTRLIVRVCLEREADAREFHMGGERLGNFIPERQRTAARIYANSGGEHAAGPIIVTFWDFESGAIGAAHADVSKAELLQWGRTLGLGSELWTVEGSGWAAPVVFVRTAEQAVRYRDSPESRAWADSYRELVRPHDEFGYLTMEHCRIGVDSKENFDTTFDSNWFYYWR